MRAPKKTTTLACSALGLAFVLTGCPEDKNKAEKAGEKIEEAGDKIEDKIDKNN